MLYSWQGFLQIHTRPLHEKEQKTTHGVRWCHKSKGVAPPSFGNIGCGEHWFPPGSSAMHTSLQHGLPNTTSCSTLSPKRPELGNMISFRVVLNYTITRLTVFELRIIQYALVGNHSILWTQGFEAHLLMSDYVTTHKPAKSGKYARLVPSSMFISLLSTYGLSLNSTMMHSVDKNRIFFQGTASVQLKEVPLCLLISPWETFFFFFCFLLTIACPQQPPLYR